MKKFLGLFILIISLNFSLEYDCSDLLPIRKCGIFNTDFNYKCQVVKNKCVEAQVDSGCQINGDTCSKTGTNKNEQCYFYPTGDDDLKVCKKYTFDDGCSITWTDTSISCTTSSNIISYAICSFDSQNEYYCKKNNQTCGYSYFDKDNNCGGFKGINEAEKKQCAQLSNSNQCQQILIDSDCAIDNNGDCKKREGANFNDNEYTCKLTIGRSGVSDNVQCKKKTICEARDLSNCRQSNDNCYYVDGESECKKIEVDKGCKVESGSCQEDTDDATNYHHYQKCVFNDDKTKCQLKDKECSEILSSTGCSDCKTVSSGKECKKVNTNYYCKEITINAKCKVDDNGDCSIKTPETNKDCSFDYNPVTKCELYEVDPGCTIDQYTGECEDDTKNLINNKKCVFKDPAKTQCKLEDVTSCEDYKIDTKCEADTKIKKDNLKCSWNIDSCKQYTIQSPCTVSYAACSETPTDNKVCLFNIEKNECIPREKKCSNYYNQERKCYSEFTITSTSTKQCIQYSEDNYCKEIEIDQYCKVNEYDNSCGHRDSNYQQKDGICVFDDEVNKNKCTKRERKCTEYTDNTCESLEKCSYYPNKYKCYETDEYCTCNIDNYGNFQKRSDKTLAETEKCDMVKLDEKGGFICKKVDKECLDYTDSSKCSNVARTKEKQCYKFSGWSKCQEINLDGYCYVDENGKCVKDPSASLSNNEICDFNYDKTKCTKREKLCSDIANNECTSYTPLNKKCYKVTLDGKEACQEIKVDSQCSIDENGECKGKGCSFEDNDTKERCAYKNSGSLLKLKRLFTILSLLILF